MARKTETDIALVTDHGWLTLKQAAKLTNTPLDRLRRMIRTGDLHAFTVERNGTTKFRVSRAALVDAGLLKAGGTQESATSFDLLALIRDQNQRIGRLEDQRAQLAGQLGIAMERVRAVDERLAWLEQHPAESAPDATTEADGMPHSEPSPSSTSLTQRSGVLVVRSLRRVSDATHARPWRRPKE